MYLLGIDLGTTGCKSMVFDEKGTICGSDYIECDLIMTDDGIDQDANLWWENVKQSVKSSVGQAGISGEEIAALSVSSQGISFVPIDKDGNTLQNAISWLDGRSTEELALISKKCNEKDVFYHTGKLIRAYVLPQFMWVRDHRREVYDKTYKVLMPMDYIMYKFTGKTVTDLSMAAGTLCYDIHKKEWMPEMFEKFGIDQNMFPELGVLGDVVGTVLPDVAAELGLSEKTKVVLGAQDQRCASFGAGISEGIITISLGTASAICAICDEPLIDDQMKVTCCGLDRDRWMLETVVGTAGVAFKWLKNTMFENLSFRDLDVKAEQAAPGSSGVMFFPHLSEDTGGSAKGAFMGMSLQTKPDDIIRSVLEGISYQINMHIKNMERIGAIGNEIRIFGGGAKSDIWCQIIADVTGKKVVVPRTNETANLGAAIIAGIGAGVFQDFEDAYRIAGGISKEYMPNLENKELYGKLYEKYMQRDTVVKIS